MEVSADVSRGNLRALLRIQLDGEDEDVRARLHHEFCIALEAGESCNLDDLLVVLELSSELVDEDGEFIGRSLSVSGGKHFREGDVPCGRVFLDCLLADCECAFLISEEEDHNHLTEFVMHSY